MFDDRSETREVFMEEDDDAKWSARWSPWSGGTPVRTRLYWVEGGVLHNALENAWGASFDIPMKSWVLASSRSTAKMLFIEHWNREFEAEIAWTDPISIRLRRRGVVCVTEEVVDPCYHPRGIEQALLDIMRQWSQHIPGVQ